MFRGSQEYEAGLRTESVAAGDLNGDGLPDVVVTYNNGDNVSVLLHSGDSDVSALFQQNVSIPCGGYARFVSLADMNKDGRLDIVTANYPGSISVMLGRGNGSFGTPTVYPLSDGQAWRTLVIADVNKDSWPDIVFVMDQARYAISVMLGTGGGALGPVATYPYSNVNEVFERLAVAEVTGDGKIDVVAEGSSVVIFQGNNTGSFTVANTVASGHFGEGLAVGFLNADAIPDIVVGGDFFNNENGLSVFLGTGGGNFLSSVFYPLVQVPSCFVLTDRDGDGHTDIISGGTPESPDLKYSIAVLHGSASGTFGAPSYFSAIAPMGGIALADVDMNGQADLIASSWGGHLGPFAHTVGVLLDDAGGGFQSTPWSLDARKPVREAVADFDRDGKADVAYSDSASVRIGLGNGSGVFTDIGGPTLAQTPNGDVVVADWNRDGIPDLAVQSGNVIRAFYNIGGGTLNLAFSFSTSKLHPKAIVDLNRDSRPDMIISGTGFPTVMRTMLQAVDGTFAVAQNLTLSSPIINCIATGDFNCDGKADVAVATISGLSVLTGIGTGSLNPEIVIATGHSYCDLYVGDFNRDGKQDIAALDSLVTQTGVRGFDVFLGNGTGGFGLPTSFPTLEPNGYRIDSWDVNVDGIPDMIIGGYSNTDVSSLYRAASVEVHLGAGNGAFGLRTAYPLGVTYGFTTQFTAPAFASGDVNGDGLPDLVSSTIAASSDGTSWARAGLLTLLGIPPDEGNGLNPHTDYSMIGSTKRLAIGDLNRDGIPDVVSGSISAPGVSVRLGTGSGILGSRTDVTQCVGVVQVALADMNRDGILDLVISRGDIGTPDIVSVMLGVGDGTFGPRLDLPVAGAGDFDVADMNRDAIPDVLVAQPSLNRVRVLLGNGDGTLTELMDPLGGDIPSVIEDVEVADLNRDGIQDVVAAAGGLYYASNAGNGNLTHGIQINLGSTTIQRVRVADIDRDGYPDILATDQSAQLIVAFGPNFTTYVTSTLPANAWDLRIGPAEADGRPFVYMPLQGLSQVAVLAPTTPGAYSVAGVYADGTGPLAIAIADMNRDGLLDAVTANITLGQVSVLLHGPNVVTGIAEDAPLVARPRLDQNYPNPFNPSTTVRFSVPQKGTAQLRVFDVRGRLVRTLVDGMVLAGDHHVPWDGANDQGHPVASGVYLYRLTTAAGYGESKRMVLLR